MPEYVIHLGPHKTGSTYLQARFVALRRKLDEQGVIYPAQWNDGDQVSQVSLVRRLRAHDHGLIDEFAALNNSSHRIVLISCEDLSDLKPDEIAFFRQLVGRSPLKLIFYCRRWSELLLSGWRELVKHGYTRTLPELLSASLANPHGSHIVNFKIRLDRFSSEFGHDAIHLASYSNLADRKIDLFEHFAKEFLDWQTVPALPPARINVANGPEETELVRALNALSCARYGAADPGLFPSYLKASGSLETGPLLAAMSKDMRGLIVNEDAPGLRSLHQQLFREYDGRLVEPRSGPFLFAPKPAPLPYIGQDYLLVEGMIEVLAGILNRLRAPA